MLPDDKRELRRVVRVRFPGGETRDRESALICGHIASWRPYQEARMVAGYLPLPWEADVTPLLRDALASGKTLLLPRVEGESLTLRRVERMDALIPGRWGIPEPPEDAPIVPVSEAQLLLVPLEAIDGSGMRLGKGGGFYDALLQGCGAVSLGIALSWQRVERVPRESWDQPLSAVADQDGIERFR